MVAGDIWKPSVWKETPITNVKYRMPSKMLFFLAYQTLIRMGGHKNRNGWRTVIGHSTNDASTAPIIHRKAMYCGGSCGIAGIKKLPTLRWPIMAVLWSAT